MAEARHAIHKGYAENQTVCIYHLLLQQKQEKEKAERSAEPKRSV